MISADVRAFGQLVAGPQLGYLCVDKFLLAQLCDRNAMMPVDHKIGAGDLVYDDWGEPTLGRPFRWPSNAP